MRESLASRFARFRPEILRLICSILLPAILCSFAAVFVGLVASFCSAVAKHSVCLPCSISSCATSSLSHSRIGEVEVIETRVAVEDLDQFHDQVRDVIEALACIRASKPDEPTDC